MQDVRSPQRAGFLYRQAEDHAEYEQTQSVRDDERNCLAEGKPAGKVNESEEEARLARQKPIICQNLFKTKPLKKISSTSLAGDRIVNRITAGAVVASTPSPTVWSSSTYQTTKSVPASRMTHAKFA